MGYLPSNRGALPSGDRGLFECMERGYRSSDTTRQHGDVLLGEADQSRYDERC